MNPSPFPDWLLIGPIQVQVSAAVVSWWLQLVELCLDSREWHFEQPHLLFHSRPRSLEMQCQCLIESWGYYCCFFSASWAVLSLSIHCCSLLKNDLVPFYERILPLTEAQLLTQSIDWLKSQIDRQASFSHVKWGLESFLRGCEWTCGIYLLFTVNP